MKHNSKHSRANKHRRVKLKKIKWNRLKGILMIAGVALIVFTAVFIGASTTDNVAVSGVTDGFRQLFASQKGEFPYRLESVNAKQIRPIGDDVLVLYNDSAFVLTDSARTTGKIQYDFAEARAYTCNGRALVYDTVKNAVLLMSKTEKISSLQLDKDLVTASLAQNGCFAVVTQGGESTSELTVYSPEGTKKFGWTCANERIIDVSFSHDGKRVAVAAVGSKNAVIYSRLLVFNLKKGTTVSELSYDDTMLLRIQFNAKGGLTAVGDNRYDIYNKKFAVKESLSFTENALIAVAFDDEGNGAICLAENGGSKTTIHAVSSKGTKRFQQTVDGAVQAVSVSSSRIVIAVGRSITAFDKSGVIKNTFTAQTVPDEMIVAGSEVFTVEEDSVIKY